MSDKCPDQCPECGGEVTFGFGLAGGGAPDEAGEKTVPGHYFMCLDCEWMSSRPKETLCFPFGLVR